MALKTADAPTTKPTPTNADGVPIVDASRYPLRGMNIVVIDQHSLPLPVTGTLEVTPPGTQTVNDGGGSITVDDGGTPLNVAISAPVEVTGPVEVTATTPLPVGGTVDVGNFPSGLATETTLASILAAFAQTFTVNGSGYVQPVSGTFWQATQPVSIAATVNVAGTFWQATQPVSLAAPVSISGTVPISIALPVAVTGTFWQAVQPVSGSVAISGAVDVSGSIVNAAQLGTWNVNATPIGTTTVSGSVTAIPSGTQTVTGSVGVTSVVPGTGATNLGKAFGNAIGMTDTGVTLAICRHSELTEVAADESVNQYTHLITDAVRALRVNPEHTYVIDTAEATTGWSALNADTTGLATSTNHIIRTAALTFNKIDGAANSTICGIQKTITTINLGEVRSQDMFKWCVFVTATANITYAFIRLGTDSSNYNEWRVPVSELQATEWNNVGVHIGESIASVGNGWNSAAVSYVATGLIFSLETNALSGIVVDNISFHSLSHVDVTSTTGQPIPIGMKNASGVIQSWPVNIFNKPTVSINSFDSSTQVCGTDGSTVRILSTDTGGRLRAEQSGTYYNGSLSNTKQTVKASSVFIRKYVIENPNTSGVYVQVWNLLAASVTVGTTAATDVWPVPAGTTSNGPGRAEISLPNVAYGTGLVIAVTTTPTGSTAPTFPVAISVYSE